jgi:hypothetical protein
MLAAWGFVSNQYTTRLRGRMSKRKKFKSVKQTSVMPGTLIRPLAGQVVSLTLGRAHADKRTGKHPVVTVDDRTVACVVKFNDGRGRPDFHKAKRAHENQSYLLEIVDGPDYVGCEAFFNYRQGSSQGLQTQLLNEFTVVVPEEQ